ncbi:MAG: MarR family winged helix-turn-helix transcriptional regulator [Armatimonadota bacterium]
MHGKSVVAAGKPSRAEVAANAARDLSRILKAVDDYSKHMQSRHGVSGPQLWALWELRDSRGLTVTQLARRMYLHPSTISGMAGRLEAKGLARRDRDEQDRRVVRLEITKAGSKLLQRAPSPARHRLLKALEDMPDSRLRALGAGMSKLAAAMEAQD